MTYRDACVLVSAFALAAAAWAQVQAPGSINNRRPTAGKSATAKEVKPDPDLLDGSIYDAEERPLYGMLAEFELPGSEEKGERVGGQSEPAGEQSQSASPPQGPTGGSAQPQQQEQSQGGQPPPIESGTDDRQEPAQQGQQGQPQGIQAQKLEGPQSAGGPQDQSKPRDMKIGDASLQIQTVPKNTPQVVGTEQVTTTQQYEKKVPQGQQTDNRNKGVERGKVMPKGI